MLRGSTLLTQAETLDRNKWCSPSDPYRRCIHQDVSPDKTHIAIPKALYRADCRCAQKSCRRGCRRNRSTSIAGGRGLSIGGE
jgi:hypothetical protein